MKISFVNIFSTNNIKNLKIKFIHLKFVKGRHIVPQQINLKLMKNMFNKLNGNFNVNNLLHQIN